MRIERKNRLDLRISGWRLLRKIYEVYDDIVSDRNDWGGGKMRAAYLTCVR